MSVRWIRAQVSQDSVLWEGEGIALAGLVGPTLLLSVGGWQLALSGEDTFQQVESAIRQARLEHSLNGPSSPTAGRAERIAEIELDTAH